MVAGVTTVCNWSTPKAEPPNSPAMTARWEPGATALPDAPASKVEKSGAKLWMLVGAVQVPGDPPTYVTPARLTKTTFAVNSTGAKAIPVLQSSAVESMSGGKTTVLALLYTLLVAVSMIWNTASSLADSTSLRTGSTEMFSLVRLSNNPMTGPKVL